MKSYWKEQKYFEFTVWKYFFLPKIIIREATKGTKKKLCGAKKNVKKGINLELKRNNVEQKVNYVEQNIYFLEPKVNNVKQKNK